MFNMLALALKTDDQGSSDLAFRCASPDKK
jgi:hypothetical protein